MSRERVLSDLLDAIREVKPEQRILVALDGVDGAGKTHLAEELVALAARTPGRPVSQVSIDGFHRPREQRYAAGRGPEGFYQASYDYHAFREAVVDRLRAGEPVIAARWDVESDSPVELREIAIPPDGIVVVDGIFLHRPDLRDVWDASVWVEVPFAVSVPRGNARFPGEHDPDPEAPGNARYVGGQRLYLVEADPRAHATWILDNTDLDFPVLHRRA